MDVRILFNVGMDIDKITKQGSFILHAHNNNNIIYRQISTINADESQSARLKTLSANQEATTTPWCLHTEHFTTLNKLAPILNQDSKKIKIQIFNKTNRICCKVISSYLCKRSLRSRKSDSFQY